MARVCPSCGRTVEAAIRGLCPECFPKIYGVARLPGRVEVQVCRYCGRILLGGRWVTAGSFEDAVESIAGYILSRARPVEPLENVELSRLGYETKPDWTTRVHLVLRGRYRGVMVVGGSDLVVQLRPSICPLCKTRVSGEYDTVLSILDAPTSLEDEVLALVEDRGLASQLVDIIRVKDGLNIYFTNRGAASKLVKMLSRVYNIERLGEAYEEVGIDSSGRRRTRRTITVRIRGRR